MLLHKPIKGNLPGQKPFSTAVAFPWPGACHRRLHFCLLVTCSTLRKKLQGTSQEVGIENRPGLCSRYVTQPPPPLQSVRLHWKRKHRTQFPFFFWCQLKTKHAACDIFLDCIVWADGSETVLDVMVFLRCIPNSRYLHNSKKTGR